MEGGKIKLLFPQLQEQGSLCRGLQRISNQSWQNSLTILAAFLYPMRRLRSCSDSCHLSPPVGRTPALCLAGTGWRSIPSHSGKTIGLSSHRPCLYSAVMDGQAVPFALTLKKRRPEAESQRFKSLISHEVHQHCHPQLQPLKVCGSQ